MIQPMFLDLVNFVFNHKADKTFMGYPLSRIILMLKTGIDEGTLLYSLDNKNRVTGMVLAEKDDNKKILLVTENLAMSLPNLKEFAKVAKQRWPGYKLEWIKHGNRKSYDSTTVYKKLKV